MSSGVFSFDILNVLTWIHAEVLVGTKLNIATGDIRVTLVANFCAVVLTHGQERAILSLIEFW